MYFYLKLESGKHKIKSITENTQTLELEMKENENYFVWQEAKMGLQIQNYI